MKLSISRDLHDRAWSCSLATHEKMLKNFVELAVLNDSKGRLSHVVVDEKMLTTTQEDSFSFKFSGNARGMTGPEVKLALVRAVLFVEASQPSPLGADVTAEIKDMNEASLKLARRMEALGVSQ